MKRCQKKKDIFNKTEKQYMNDLSELSLRPFLTNKEILNNILLYRSTKDRDYIDIIIRNFIKLLIQKARKYKTNSVEVGDLIHYGIDGLIEAIEWSYKLQAKEKFITYITTVIERRMKDGLDNHKNAIRLPKHIMTQQRKLRHKKNSNTIIYSKLNIDKFEDFEYFNDGIDYFNIPIEKILDSEALQFDVYRILDQLLTPIEIQVLSHNFGLKGENAKNLGDIGVFLNLSSAEIRIIYKEAIDKIKSNENSIIILKKYLI